MNKLVNCYKLVGFTAVFWVPMQHSFDKPEDSYTEMYRGVNKLLFCFVFFSKLGLHLPNPVDSKNGRAQWDKSKQLLTVTVRLVREYDFVNQ